MFSTIAPSVAQIGVTAIVAGVWAYLSVKKEQLVEIPVPVIKDNWLNCQMKSGHIKELK